MADRAVFTQARAADFPGSDFDLVCFFDCLHDMGDPVGAARRAHAALKPGGTVLLVEPFANDRLEDNLNPVGRLFYAASRSAQVNPPPPAHVAGGRCRRQPGLQVPASPG